MSPGCHRTITSRFSSYGPKLIEGTCSLNRRLVDSLTLVDVVAAFFKRKVSLKRPRFSRCEITVVLYDIVFDERTRSPAINRKVARSRGCVCATVFDSPGMEIGSVLLFIRNIQDSKQETNLDPPGLQPFPHTKPPPPLHFAVYEPPLPLLHWWLPPPSCQNDQ